MQMQTQSKRVFPVNFGADSGGYPRVRVMLPCLIENPKCQAHSLFRTKQKHIQIINQQRQKSKLSDLNGHLKSSFVNGIQSLNTYNLNDIWKQLGYHNNNNNINPPMTTTTPNIQTIDLNDNNNIKPSISTISITLNFLLKTTTLTFLTITTTLNLLLT